MSAADYYGASGGGGRDNYGGSGSNPGGLTRNEDAGPYTSQGALPYPSSSSGVPYPTSSNTSGINTAYSPHHTPSPASQNPNYPDPFADNIPLQETGKNKHHLNPYGQQDGSNKHASVVYSENDAPKRKKPFAWVSWGLALIQIGVFIGELVKNAQLTKSPIAIKPQFNPMIGPSQFVLINMGSRFVPCMTTIPGITNEIERWMCPNTTSADPRDYNCNLDQLCGLSGIPKNAAGQFQPNQWYRFITPIFLHAGVIHIGFNMLLQLRLGVDMEREIGPIRYSIVYFVSGIFGFILGANYSPNGISSMGASGCLFGIIALVLLDILYHWKELKHPMRDLLWLLLEIAISFVIGLLPGLDNFSHLGGFLMGILLGLTVMRSPPVIASRIGRDPPYEPVTPATYGGSSGTGGFRSFFKSPAGFFKGRKPAWWAWWLVRAATVATAIIVFSVLINNFYVYRKECKWCKYLSCLPVSNWCSMGNLTKLEA